MLYRLKNIRKMLYKFLVLALIITAAPMQGVAPKQAQAAVTDSQRAVIESCLYNAEYYEKANDDVAVALGRDEEAMYEHWLNCGMAEGRNASMVFNAKYYLEKNPSVAAKVGNDYVAAYEHFVNEGLLAGLESSPVFSVKYYLEANTDVAQAFNGDYVSAAKHFNENAIAEGRSGSGNFDYTVYRACNTDVEELYGNYIEGYYIHYINHGRAEGRTGGLAADGSGGNSGNTGVGTLGTLKTVTESFDEKLISNDVDLWTYSASIAPVSQFVTADGGYGVAYHGEDTFTVLLYSKDLVLYDKVTMLKEYGQLGAVICDEYGNFYAVYGIENETEDVSKEVLRVVKYSPAGKTLQSISYTGDETGWSGVGASAGVGGSGTKLPFRSSNCCLAINQDILTITYGRGMYNGHQASNSLYIKASTMEKIDIKPIYTSHSFDQQVMATMDGGFLFADHGDAYGRGFVISKQLKDSKAIAGTLTTFHFREGSNRGYGYNETYAQLGGMAELANSYVVVAASERTLSLDVAPTNREYCGHSEARDLFIQYLKKDYYAYEEADCYSVGGAVRPATGTKPTDALTELRLNEDAVDYGVIWLTNYEDEYFVYNPKVVTTEAGNVVILWQKVCYETEKTVDTYYMVLDSQGNVLQDATSLGPVSLSKDEPVVYLDGSIYWSVTDGRNLTSYRFIISENIVSELEDDVAWRIFDAEYYLQKYPALEELVGTDETDLYLYWLNVGISLGHSASPVLDPFEYLQINTDVASAVDYDFAAATQHFLNYGIYEGRSGNREFDYTVYAYCNTDVGEVFGDDIVGYYFHYVKYGIAEGRTARLVVQEEEKPQDTMTLVPEGVKKFITPEGILVHLTFKDGRMTAQKFFDSNGTVLDELRCYYYNDPENTSFWYRDNYDNSKVWRTEYTDGSLKSKAEDASKGAFAYMDIVSENADGTITVQYKEVDGGCKIEKRYDEMGQLDMEEVTSYNESGQYIQSKSIYYTEGELDYYEISEYKNDKVIKMTSFDKNDVITKWIAFEYDDDNNLISITNNTYTADGYYITKRDGNQQLYYYEEYVKTEEYFNHVVRLYENGELVKETWYDEEGNVIRVRES